MSYPGDPYSSGGFQNYPVSGASAREPQQWASYPQSAEPEGYNLQSSAYPQSAGYPQSPAYAQPAPNYPVRVNPYGPPGLQLPAPYGIEPVTGLPYSPKSKTTAGLLGIFLGGFGVGRFYTGHVGLGIAQLLVTVFTFGFGAWWGLIDGIVMLAGRPTDSDGLPLR